MVVPSPPRAQVVGASEFTIGRHSYSRRVPFHTSSIRHIFPSLHRSPKLSSVWTSFSAPVVFGPILFLRSSKRGLSFLRGGKFVFSVGGYWCSVSFELAHNTTTKGWRRWPNGYGWLRTSARKQQKAPSAGRVGKRDAWKAKG